MFEFEHEFSPAQLIATERPLTSNVSMMLLQALAEVTQQSQGRQKCFRISRGLRSGRLLATGAGGCRGDGLEPSVYETEGTPVSCAGRKTVFEFEHCFSV